MNSTLKRNPVIYTCEHEWSSHHILHSRAKFLRLRKNPRVEINKPVFFLFYCLGCFVFFNDVLLVLPKGYFPHSCIHFVLFFFFYVTRSNYRLPFQSDRNDLTTLLTVKDRVIFKRLLKNRLTLRKLTQRNTLKVERIPYTFFLTHLHLYSQNVVTIMVG